MTMGQVPDLNGIKLALQYVIIYFMHTEQSRNFSWHKTM